MNKLDKDTFLKLWEETIPKFDNKYKNIVPIFWGTAGEIPEGKAWYDTPEYKEPKYKVSEEEMKKAISEVMDRRYLKQRRLGYGFPIRFSNEASWKAFDDAVRAEVKEQGLTFK